MYSIGTLITALAPNFIFFLIFRGLTSIPVAAEYSAVTASVAEFMPSKYRGQMTTLILGLWAVGSIAATGINALVLPKVSDSIGWRITFSLGSIYYY
jgi:MFS family permease